MGGQGTMYLGVGADTRGAEAGIKRVKDQVQDLRRSFWQAGQTQKSLQRFGAPALSALSAGFSAASSAADGFNTSMAAVGASMLSAFAAGGPGGLAIAAIGTTIGGLIAHTNKAEAAAKSYAAELSKVGDELKKAAEVMEKRLLTAQAKMIEAQSGGRIKAQDIIDRGMEEAERRALQRDISLRTKEFSEARERREAAWRAAQARLGAGPLSVGSGIGTGDIDAFAAAADAFMQAARNMADAQLMLDRFEETLKGQRLAAEAVAGMAPPTTVAGAAAATGFARRTMGGGSIHEFIGVAGGDLPMTEDQGDDLIEVTRRIERNTANPPPARAR